MEINYREMKLDMIRKLTLYLEYACKHKAARDRSLFDILLGQASAIKVILEDYFDFYESNYSEYLRSMIEVVMYEEW